jgi:hypothetical protein
VLIKLILRIYFLFCFSVMLHELFHFISAKFLRFKDINICLGYEGFFCIKICRLFISPFMITGSVSFSLDENNILSKRKYIVFYLSGGLANIILIIFGIFIDSLVLFSINSIILLLIYLPIKTLQNDMVILLEKLKTNK